MPDKKEPLGYASSDETKGTDEDGGSDGIDRYYREPPSESAPLYLLFGIILLIMVVATAAFEGYVLVGHVPRWSFLIALALVMLIVLMAIRSARRR